LSRLEHELSDTLPEVDDSLGWSQRRLELAKTLLRHLLECGLFRTWLRHEPEGWELVSGIWSPFYIQARGIPSHPEVFKFVGHAIAEVVQNELGRCDNLVGLATAGIPLASVAAIALDVPMCYTRKLAGIRSMDDVAAHREDYGDHSMVEGKLINNSRVVLVDDVCAQFTSKQVAHWQVMAEVKNRRLRNVSIPAVMVLVDREQSAAAPATATQLGMKILSVVKLKSEGLELLRDILSEREHQVVTEYIANPNAFQNPGIRKQLAAEARKQKELHKN
jgi:orotate phosphoribosyltransferase